MLLRLHIENLAIIDRLTLDFEPGFTALTGETGAGKSIILGALNLVLGERASSDDVRSGCPGALVEALFDLTKLTALHELLGTLHLNDQEPAAGAIASNSETAPINELVIRREVSANGRSRCLINGKLVPLAQVKTIGEHLVDLHGQHQHQSLLKVELHREILDDFGGRPLIRCLETYEAQFQAYRRLLQKIQALDRNEQEVARQQGLLEFQINEIDELELSPGEDESLELERLRLQHADLLLRNSALISNILFEGEGEPATASGLISRCESLLHEAARVDPSLQSLQERLESSRAEIDDIAATLRSFAAEMEHQPSRLEEVEDRIHSISRLKKKYGNTVEAIFEARNRFEEELYSLTHRREELEQLHALRIKLEKDLAKAADDLTLARQKTGETFSKGLLRQLKELDMPGVRFEVRLEKEIMDATRRDLSAGRPGEDEAIPAQSQPQVVTGGVYVTGLDGKRVRLHDKGADLVEFLISTNPGEDLKPLRKIASGGELSRIMLSLKALMRTLDQVPTLIFDEVDTGISGRTGARIGEKMADLGKEYQVICITHLPQIAAQAQAHFAVTKKRQGRRTLTRVDRLLDEQRLEEIARLLGGPVDSAIARKHARELLAQPE
ncbi:MAG: DNA repair protein RecN [Planctomycetes bacterium]|nr:DNA repair protein RecN [Planctomycetota bacterium]